MSSTVITEGAKEAARKFITRLNWQRSVMLEMWLAQHIQEAIDAPVAEEREKQSRAACEERDRSERRVLFFQKERDEYFTGRNKAINALEVARQEKAPIIFSVHGIPKPAGSKRAFVIKKGGHFTGRAIVTDANPNSRDWKIDVQHSAKEHCPEVWTCPISITFTFYLPRPKNHYRGGKNSHLLKTDAPAFPCGKPDATKLCRGVEDALTGVAWKDDAQIVNQHVLKRYGKPGVTVEIYEETA